MVDFLFRAATGNIFPTYNFRHDVVETTLGCPTHYYLTHPERFSQEEHTAVREYVYQLLHEMKILYNYRVAGTANHSFLNTLPLHGSEMRLSEGWHAHLDPNDTVTQLLAAAYPNLVPFNFRLVLRARRQWDAVVSWFTGPKIGGKQGPVLLRQLGLAGEDYFGRQEYLSRDASIPQFAVGGCSFPKRPQPMPLDLQLIAELSDF